MALNWGVQLGTTRLIEVQVLNPDDSVPTGQFQDSDALQAVLWQGASTVPVWTKGGAPDVLWISSSNAQFSIALHPADSASLAQGEYYLTATATRGSDVAQLLPAGSTITFTAAPGTSSARPAYTDATDLRRLAPWIDDVQAPGSETGFLEQCADARSWLDENILRNYGGGYVSLLGEHGTALASWAVAGVHRSSLRNPWILQLLAQGPAVAGVNGGLIVTRRTRDVCAYYALSRICDGMLTRGGVYPGLAARYRCEAERLLVGYTAELSVLGQVDQWGQLLAQIPINFGTARTLRV